MPHFFRSLALAMLLALLALSSSASAVAGEKPNIILIMADDVGIEGLGCYGGISYQTPHLDQMAQQGIRFSHAYAQPLCTPTRVQLMTGKYNHRNWVSFGILDPNEKTFGHALQTAGYQTGIFGKWQLQSYDPPDLPGASKRRGTGMHPKDAGFDEYALFHALETEDKGSRYANPTMLEGHAGEPGEIQTYAGRYGEDVWVEKILDFFDRHESKPKFVYYPMALPHWPFQPTPNSDNWDPTKPETDLRYSTDMIEYMDTAVGNLMAGLQKRGLKENTLVIFYSDNGTHLQVSSRMKDGRTIQGGKATPNQNGIHVPLIVHWPAKCSPSVCNDLVDASDFFPTLLELAGVETSEAKNRDGISFAPQILGKPSQPRQTAFFWYDPRPGWDKERFRRSVFAVNKNYKLFRTGQLFRLTDRPLEEIAIDPLELTEEDRIAKQELEQFIGQQMQGVDEPALVDAYGQKEHDFSDLPANRQEAATIAESLLKTGEQVVYGDPEIKQHRLWIFNPLDIQPDELRPCVVFFHGGGWGGKPSALAAQSVYLQRRGINAVSVHFRAPAGKLTPADTLRDARRAYRWIVNNGKKHHIDVDHLVVSGGSAGGHLSLALATIGLDDDPVIEHLPKGMVLFNPVIDLVDGWEGGQKKCRAKKIDPQEFSPAHHVREGLPPTLVLSGSEDRLITPPMLESFELRMLDAGNECTVKIYPGADHGFFNYGRGKERYFQQTMWQFEAFLKSCWNDDSAANNAGVQ